MRTSDSIKQKISKASEIPDDILKGVPVISTIGMTKLSLENHNGILEYTDILLKIRTKCGQLRITGKNIHIESYSNDEIRLTGRIDSIELKR